MEMAGGIRSIAEMTRDGRRWPEMAGDGRRWAEMGGDGRIKSALSRTRKRNSAY